MLLAGDGTIRGANRALTRLLHLPLEGMLGRGLADLAVQADGPVVAGELATIAASSGTRSFEARFASATGDEVPMSFTVVNLLDDAAVQGLVATATDITALVEVRTQLRYLATHDDLTGLPNRASLRDRLASLLRADERSHHTVLFGDVDGLKVVNDEHGHRAGDAVLHTIAERLRSVLRPEDFVARVGGDEFVMIVATTDSATVEALQARIREVMERPVSAGPGLDVRVSISTGIATTAGAIEADEVLDAADAAMYLAKRPRDGAL
jgi:diguanylate cyclase (GGDEF)-like protein/PAS domain S-box-containing protein